MTNKEILEIEFFSNDLNKKITIKGYFKKLLIKLFEEGECFDSKRPFGNSDWMGDLYVCFIKQGIIEGKLDEDDYIEKCDYRRADKIFKDLIKEL